MLLTEIIDIASGAYPDGLVKEYALLPDEEHGDTLAKFIAIELGEVYDPNESNLDQLQSAIKAMATARDELAAVAAALEKARADRENNF